MKYYLKFNFMNQLKKLEKEMGKANLIDEKAQEDKISSGDGKDLEG